jgi:hypothetical protein
MAKLGEATQEARWMTNRRSQYDQSTAAADPSAKRLSYPSALALWLAAGIAGWGVIALLVTLAI